MVVFTHVARSVYLALKTGNSVEINLVYTHTEKELLGGLVRNLVWYQPSHSELRKFGDGGVAIIDQWIAARATYFVGECMVMCLLNSVLSTHSDTKMYRPLTAGFLGLAILQEN